MKRLILPIVLTIFLFSCKNPVIKTEVPKVVVPTVTPTPVKETLVTSPVFDNVGKPEPTNYLPVPTPTPTVYISTGSSRNNSTNTGTNSLGNGNGVITYPNNPTVITSPQIKNWFDYTLTKDNNMVIYQIINSATNRRVDDQGDSEINPNYSGKEYTLIIKGKFKEDIVQSGSIMFTNPPGLLQMSYVGQSSPKTKVLIDDAIFLEPISATTTEIKVKLNTEAISDFHLKGLHKFSIISEELRTDALIKIGDPEPINVSLVPVIDEIEILRKNDLYFNSYVYDFAFKTKSMYPTELDKYSDDTPIAIKIKGKNFPVFHKFTYSQLDTNFCFGYSTAISKNSGETVNWQSIIYISDPEEFKTNINHTLTYSTPFGIVIKEFQYIKP